MSAANTKTLVVGPSWVGDMVMAQSLLMELKGQDPNQQIDVLAPAWTAALIDRMPQASNLIEANFSHGKLGLGERFKVARKLREANYDHAIVLPNSLKSALVPALARIPKRTGFLGEQRWGLLNNIHRLDKRRLPMTVQRFIALAKEANSKPCAIEDIPAPSLQVSKAQVDAALIRHSLNLDSRVLVLCPGAEFGVSKKWPPKYYAQLAQHYIGRDWQVWLMGSQNDLQDCNTINQLAGGTCAVLAGQTSLPEAIDLISCGSMVVSNDSGLMHIAAALNIPLVAVYGSTDPSHTPPLSANHAIARLGLECSPCFKRVCPLEHLDCLNNLHTPTVIDHIERLVK